MYFCVKIYYNIYRNLQTKEKDMFQRLFIGPDSSDDDVIND